MILSHSSMALAHPRQSRSNIHRDRATHRFIEFDLGVRQVAQHLLHLSFFRILEDYLLS